MTLNLIKKNTIFLCFIVYELRKILLTEFPEERLNFLLKNYLCASNEAYT